MMATIKDVIRMRITKDIVDLFEIRDKVELVKFQHSDGYSVEHISDDKKIIYVRTILNDTEGVRFIKEFIKENNIPLDLIKPNDILDTYDLFSILHEVSHIENEDDLEDYHNYVESITYSMMYNNLSYQDAMKLYRQIPYEMNADLGAIQKINNKSLMDNIMSIINYHLDNYDE